MEGREGGRRRQGREEGEREYEMEGGWRKKEERGSRGWRENDWFDGNPTRD